MTSLRNCVCVHLHLFSPSKGEKMVSLDNTYSELLCQTSESKQSNHETLSENLPGRRHSFSRYRCSKLCGEFLNRRKKLEVGRKYMKMTLEVWSMLVYWEEARAPKVYSLGPLLLAGKYNKVEGWMRWVWFSSHRSLEAWLAIALLFRSSGVS